MVAFTACEELVVSLGLGRRGLSSFQVSEPTTPSLFSPCALWKALSALTVFGP